MSHDAYAALKERDFRRYLVGHAAALMGQVMLGTAVGWELYERTGSALNLGYVGLVQIIPVLLFALPAGQWADRADRKRIVMGALALMAVASLGLAAWSATSGPLWLVYFCLFLAGVAQAFRGPAGSAILPNLVSRENLDAALTWSTSAMQFAVLLGPGLAGAIIALTHRATAVYVLDAFAAAAYCVALASVHVRPTTPSGEHAPGWAGVSAGLRFVFGAPLILAGITLDMIAVLLGGATALMPIFAKDVLHVGPTGLGWLMAAPALGAFLTGLLLAHRPPIRRNGPTLLAVVAGFGACTIGFGLSRSFPLSWLCLFGVGATDMVSMVIRQHLVQRLTPDAFRGRVGAVHSVFVGTSNELGGFESGATAAWLGPVRSVVYGGIGTLLTVAAVAWAFPALRALGTIVAVEPDEKTGEAEATPA